MTDWKANALTLLQKLGCRPTDPTSTPFATEGALRKVRSPDYLLKRSQKRRKAR
jgi:hypothetical protein